MSAVNRRDFVLPGFCNNLVAVRRCIFALAFAYSRRHNPRRVEYPFYGVWDLVLNALIDDQDKFIVVPQHLIYYVIEKSPYHDPDNSVGTIADHTAQNVFPDFAVIRVRHQTQGVGPRERPAPQDPQPYEWRRFKIMHAGVPILLEVKRPPSRKLTGSQFSEQLRTRLLQARVALIRQATYHFTSDTGSMSNSVVLMACSGEWWMWKIGYKQEFIPEPQTSDTLPSVDEDISNDDDDGDDDINNYAEVSDNSDIDEDDGNHVSVAARRAPSKKGSEDELALNFTPHITIPLNDKGMHVEPEVDDVEEAWDKATKEWCRGLRLGTPASNQRFYLIHRVLKEIVESKGADRG